VAVAEFIALVAAGLFAGAAIYVTLVEHPARVEGGAAVALAEFRPSYRRGVVMQASLAALGSLAALVAWLQRGHGSVLIAGLLLGAMIPFTLIVILPTNKRLLAPDLDPERTEAMVLLARWGRLHAVRTLAGAVTFLILSLHVLAGPRP